jgi:hypothetical protein
MVLLATVLGFPDLGPTLFPDLHHAAAADPPRCWSAYLDAIPLLADTHDRDRWTDLTHALRGITAAAAVAGLPLPQRLDVWASWVVPIGRVSFPTCTAVSDLP